MTNEPPPPRATGPTDAEVRLRCIEMASVVMQHTKAPAETSARFASNVFAVVNEFYAFASGKKDVTGADLLADALGRSPESTPPAST